MSDFGRVTEKRVPVHGLEANLKGLQIIRHQFLCIQRMSTESLNKCICGSNKKS